MHYFHFIKINQFAQVKILFEVTNGITKGVIFGSILPSLQQQLHLWRLCLLVGSGGEIAQCPPIILMSVGLLGDPPLVTRLGCLLIGDSPPMSCLSSRQEDDLIRLRQFRNFPQRD